MKTTTQKISAAGLLIALGIIYGDIGTSPLYVFNAIISDRTISDDLILGTLSCIIWTLTLQTTLKYVILVLQADNRGEGGTFALYALVRRRKKWLVIPAMVGGASLLADGIITPPISITSAVEGLKELPALGIEDGSNTVVIIEHNLDVIKTADWLIDLGPNGGAGGGQIIAKGSPEDVANNAASFTGKYLKPLLKAKSPLPAKKKKSLEQASLS